MSESNHRLWSGPCFRASSALCHDRKADFIYTDPPWGRVYKTYSPENPRGVSGFMEDLYTSFLPACSPSTLVWIEVSAKEVDLVRAASSRAGFLNLAIMPTEYGQGIPMAVLMFSLSHIEVPAGYQDSIKYLRGYAALCACVRPFSPQRGQILLDPFVGLTKGKTARFALQMGMTFYGADRDEERLLKASNVLKHGAR